MKIEVRLKAKIGSCTEVYEEFKGTCPRILDFGDKRIIRICGINPAGSPAHFEKNFKNTKLKYRTFQR